MSGHGTFAAGKQLKNVEIVYFTPAAAVMLRLIYHIIATMCLRLNDAYASCAMHQISLGG